MNLTRVLIRILLLGVVVGGGIYVTRQKMAVKDSQLVQDLEDKKQSYEGSVKGITDSLSQQTQDLAERGKQVSQHVSQILGTYVQPNDKASEQTQGNDSSQNSNTQASTDTQPNDNQSSQSNQDQNASQNNSESDQQTSDSQSNSDQSQPKPIYEETLEYGRYLYCQQVIKDYETNR